MATPYSSFNQPADGAKNAGEDFNGNFDYLDGVPRAIKTLGENMTQFMFGYIASDEKAYIADNSATDTSWTFGLIEQTETTNNQEHFMIMGIAENAAWGLGNAGMPVYLGTNGGITMTEPVISRKVGIVWAANKILLNIVW